MTTTKRCSWCGAQFTYKKQPGRPPQYCRPSHRQRQFEARKEAARMGLGAGDLVISSAAFGQLRDALYRLETEAEDALTDADDATSIEQLKSVVESLASGIQSTVAGLPEPKAES